MNHNKFKYDMESTAEEILNAYLTGAAFFIEIYTVNFPLFDRDKIYFIEFTPTSREKFYLLCEVTAVVHTKNNVNPYQKLFSTRCILTPIEIQEFSDKSINRLKLMGKDVVVLDVFKDIECLNFKYQFRVEDNIFHDNYQGYNKRKDKSIVKRFWNRLFKKVK